MSVVLRAVLVCGPAVLAAQPAAFVYRLGRDTVAIEQYTRTSTELTGDVVQRSGPAVQRFRYTVRLGKDGRPTAATIVRQQPDGTPVTAGLRETRITITRDSAIRELVYADSTPRRAFAASGATLVPPVYAYGITEILAALRLRKVAVDSLPAVAATGGLAFAGLATLPGDSARLRGGAYAMLVTFDAKGQLQSIDGSGTTNKVRATRQPGGIDLNAIARAMTPTGVLSARETARAGFGAGGMVLIDYGRPAVRERTVWAGTLVPFDSVWRAGANDATHLFTTRPLTIGTLTLAPGQYTLWVQHTRSATYLIVNAQTGQWGTQYDASKDVGRVAMTLTALPQPVELLQYRLTAQGPTRGVLELAWGPSVASVPFTVGTR